MNVETSFFVRKTLGIPGFFSGVKHKNIFASSPKQCYNINKVENFSETKTKKYLVWLSKAESRF